MHRAFLATSSLFDLRVRDFLQKIKVEDDKQLSSLVQMNSPTPTNRVERAFLQNAPKKKQAEQRPEIDGVRRKLFAEDVQPAPQQEPAQEPGNAGLTDFAADLLS